MRPRRNKIELGELAGAYTETALETIVHLLETSEDERVRLAAAREILDRAYGRPAQAVTAEHAGALTIRWLSPHDDACD
jgi:hypothetical protein